MQYPFQIGIHDQQTQKEKDHIKEFCSGEYAPIVEHTYTNKKGDKRKVFRVFLPRGCVVKETISFQGTAYLHEKRGTFYTTPLASEDGVLGKVIYKEDDKWETCDSKEWLKFCIGAEIKHTPNPELPPTFQNSAGVMKMMSQSVGESELSKGAIWQDNKKKKTPSK